MLGCEMHLEEADRQSRSGNGKGIGRKGRGTWMNAVPMITPVPKCLTEKNTHVDILSLFTRLVIIGKSVPVVPLVFYQ